MLKNILDNFSVVSTAEASLADSLKEAQTEAAYHVALDAELALVERSKKGDQEALNELYELMLPRIRTVYRGYFKNRARDHFDEMVAESWIHISHALMKFDPNEGVKFSVYAKWWVLNAISRARQNEGQIRIPGDLQLQINRLKKANSMLSQEELVGELIALGVTPDRAQTAVGLSYKSIRSEDFESEEEGGCDGVVLIDQGPLPSDRLIKENRLDPMILMKKLLPPSLNSTAQRVAEGSPAAAVDAMSLLRQLGLGALLGGPVDEHISYEREKGIVRVPVTVTPAMARQWLSNRHPKQRALSESEVSSFLDDIKGGRWNPQGGTILFNSCGQLLDGQHRLEAIAASGISVPYTMVAGAPDDSDAMITYNAGKKNTLRDVLKMDGGGRGEEFCRILKLWLNVKPRPPEMVRLARGYPREHELYQRIYTAVGAKSLKRRSPIMAALVLVARSEPDKVLDFIAYLNGDKPVVKGHPAYALNQYLIQPKEKDSISFLKACHAVHAFIEEREIKNLNAVQTIADRYLAAPIKA